MVGFWRRRRAHARHGSDGTAVLSGWSEPAPPVVPVSVAAPATLAPPVLPPPRAATRLDVAPPAAAPGATAVALVFADGAVVSLAADDPRVRPFQAALAVLVSR